MLLGTVGRPLLLSIAAADGRSDLFCQARIISSTGLLVATLSVPHQTLGIYGTNYTLNAEGYYNIMYQFFFDAGFTVNAGYETATETLDINTIRTDVLRALGLLHQNSVLDNQQYDGDENLIAARIRCYDSAAHAAAASAVSPTSYTTGQLFEYQVNASFSGGLLNKYAVTKVS